MVKDRGRLESPLPALREFATIVVVLAFHRAGWCRCAALLYETTGRMNRNLHHHTLVKPLGLGLGGYRSKLLQSTVTRVQGY